MDLKDNYKEKILNRLLDLFENRKVFKTLDFSKNNIYIDYKDKLLAYYHKEKYRYLPYFSNELDILEKNKLIFIKYDKDEEIERIYLNLNNIDSCYEKGITACFSIGNEISSLEKDYYNELGEIRRKGLMSNA